MKKTFLIVLILVAMAVLAAIVYLIWQKPQIPLDQEKNITIENKEGSNNLSNLEKITPLEENPPLSEEENNSLADVTREDCANNCSDFESDALKKNYCLEICGLNKKPVSEENKIFGNCDKLSGIEKDYCLKTSAVAEKNIEICAGIFDSKIRQSCQNRVTEDILE